MANWSRVSDAFSSHLAHSLSHSQIHTETDARTDRHTRTRALYSLFDGENCARALLIPHFGLCEIFRPASSAQFRRKELR